MGCYLKVAEDEGEEPIELPLEEDGTLLLSTLTAQFPGTSGLKFRTESNTFRGVRLADVKFHPPEDSWGDAVYYCVFLKGTCPQFLFCIPTEMPTMNFFANNVLFFAENKRKSDDNNDSLVAKSKRAYCLKCTDLVVLGIPWDLSEHRLRTYFEQYGELLMAMVGVIKIVKVEIIFRVYFSTNYHRIYRLRRIPKRVSRKGTDLFGLLTTSLKYEHCRQNTKSTIE